MGEFTSTALINGLTAAIGTNCFAILCDVATLGADPTMVQVIQAELAQGANYARKAFNLGTPTYDATQLRAEVPGVACTWAVSATDPTISFDTIVILANTTSLANQGVSGLDGVLNRFTLTGSNPFSNGDRVVVTAGVGGSVPTAAENEILTVTNSNSTSIQLLDEDNQIVPVTGAIMPLLIRNANGSVRYVASVGSQQILPGETKTFTLYLNQGKSTANVGAA
jgi:hypothetical protein